MLLMHYVMWLHSSMQTPVELVPRQLLNSALLPFELQQLISTSPVISGCRFCTSFVTTLLLRMLI
jgi:hypothetical protein